MIIFQYERLLTAVSVLRLLIYCYFFVFLQISFADICFFSFYNSYLAKGKPEAPDVLKDSPRLTALYEKVGNEPKIKDWIEKRPQTAL